MYSSDYLAIIREGLRPHAASPKKVIVVGAGMAGLVAAYELLRAGHDPLILEAAERVGGRVCTVREPFAPGLRAEVGAMRIPRVHTLTMAYIERFGLSVSPLTARNPRAFYHLRGRRHRIADANADPARLGFDLADRERGVSIAELWAEAIEPLVEMVAVEGEAAWAQIAATYDAYSVRDFLEAQHWSKGAIELFGLVFNQEALMNTACLELLREEVGSYYTDMVQVDRGMDRLPEAFLPALRDRVRLGARMVAVDQSPEGVAVHYQGPAGPAQAIGDYAILTVPFPVLRHIEVLQPFSPAKQRAIRQLHYDAAAKVFVQCRRRFWEEDEGIHGGSTFTDLPIRVVCYPQHGQETGRGVLLASYTWGEDAQRWGFLSPDERIARAVDDVAHVHPQIRQECEVGLSKVWHEDRLAGGAFALFEPGQQTALHRHIVAPEGRICFAGEHASLKHGWIQGAIESGLRAAYEVHQMVCQGGREDTR